MVCTIWIPVGALTHFAFKWPNTSRLVGSDAPQVTQSENNMDYLQNDKNSPISKGAFNGGYDYEGDYDDFTKYENYPSKNGIGKNPAVEMYEATEAL